MAHTIWPVCCLCGQIVPPAVHITCPNKGRVLSEAEENEIVQRVVEARADNRPLLLFSNEFVPSRVFDILVEKGVRND